MLVLSRKEGESLLIDGQIRVTVVEIGGRVQIGIEAPRGIRIVRSEIAELEEMDPPCCGLAQRRSRIAS